MDGACGEPWNGLLPVRSRVTMPILQASWSKVLKRFSPGAKRARRDHSLADWLRIVVEASDALLAVEPSSAWQLAHLMQTLAQIQGEAGTPGLTKRCRPRCWRKS